MNFDELLALPQYSLPRKAKEAILTDQLNELTDHHRQCCPEFHKLCSVLRPGKERSETLADLPFLPVGLFKSHSLRSIPENEVFKVLLSSGTTGQQPSRVYLDRQTAQRQTLALSRIMTHVLGPQRVPMILVETPNLIRDRHQFNARGAGLLGMMNFGRNHFYVLNDEMELNRSGLQEFLDRFGNEPFLIFGFTFMAWKYLYLELAPSEVDLSNAILIHSGGWKNLQDQAVSPAKFRELMRQRTGLRRMYNFYGMVEQVGSVFMEGDDGYLHPPNFADVIIRDPRTFEELPQGREGLIQVLSVLPRSYPGHSLLTEDVGVVHAVDSNSGQMGKAFSIIGRLPRSELRGCSDVIAAQMSR
jgi:acyl-CoA synthetase (AMP-forming)/AMP-acid ligase II